MNPRSSGVALELDGLSPLRRTSRIFAPKQRQACHARLFFQPFASSVRLTPAPPSTDPPGASFAIRAGPSGRLVSPAHGLYQAAAHHPLPRSGLGRARRASTRATRRRSRGARPARRQSTPARVPPAGHRARAGRFAALGAPRDPPQLGAGCRAHSGAPTATVSALAARQGGTGWGIAGPGAARRVFVSAQGDLRRPGATP